MDATTFFCERLENEVREDSEKTRVEINALLAENQRVLEEKLRVQIDAELMKVCKHCPPSSKIPEAPRPHDGL